MVEHTRVLVIGGGAVGVSCLYHLAKTGWTDCLLLEQNELTSGSTWHAAGNCPTYSTSWGVLKLQKYSAELYRGLGDEVGYPVNYHVVGAIRLAHTRERMDEFMHIRSMARCNGMEYEVLTPGEVPAKHPFVTLNDLAGALWDPYDGDIDPAQLTQALAKGARDLGAKIRRFAKVTALAQLSDGRWRAATDSGDEIVAETVVNAAGYRAGEVMAMIGRTLPLVTMSHQYLVTEDVPELTTRTERLPLLRDPDLSYYLRQERAGFILGPYEWRATPMWLDGIPEDFYFKLWNDDLDRLEQYINAAMERVPPLLTAGIRRVVNGPIPYSPDGNPYVGPEHGLRNFFHANTFSFGIAQAGGAGKALAEWVVYGGPEWDLWPLDRRRYTGYADAAYTTAKAIEVYQNEYASAYPNEEREASRPVKTSSLYARLKAKGAHFGARGGWERAIFFDVDGSVKEHTLSFRRPRSWRSAVAAEVKAVRERVGVLDLPGFTKFEVSGLGAEAFLDALTCSRLPRLGRVSLAYVLTERGGVLSEFTITRTAQDTFYLIAAAPAEWHDLDVLRTSLPIDGSVRIANRSDEIGTLVVAGPQSRELLGHVTTADLSNAAFPWLSARAIDILGNRTLALRVNYVGELGWELHAPMEQLPAIYDALSSVGPNYGLRDFGLYAMDSLRLDKCYRGWKTDLETGYSPYEASLDRFVSLQKPAFPGRKAVVGEIERGITQRFVPLTLDDDGEADAPVCAPVMLAGQSVGLVTSGGWSFTLNKSVALAYVRSDLASPGTKLEIEIFGERRVATVGREPLYDPENARLRA
jgi:dimethylglycine dehydrogenase